jgi:hypothetical protein
LNAGRQNAKNQGADKETSNEQERTFKELNGHHLNRKQQVSNRPRTKVLFWYNLGSR